MFAPTVSLNRIESCVTRAMFARRLSSVTLAMSCPSIRKRPEVGSNNRGIRLKSVDLPAALRPTRASRLPPGTVSETWSRAGRVSPS